VHVFALLLSVIGGVIERDPLSTQIVFDTTSGTTQHTPPLYNTVFGFGPDGSEVAKYRKLHLSRVQVGPDKTSEGSILTAGDKLCAFDIYSSEDNDVLCRVGLLNCFDLRFSEVSKRLCSAEGGIECDVLLYPSAWLNSTGEMGHW
jgi:predicted amidohydrolase